MTSILVQYIVLEGEKYLQLQYNINLKLNVTRHCLVNSDAYIMLHHNYIKRQRHSFPRIDKK